MNFSILKSIFEVSISQLTKIALAITAGRKIMAAQANFTPRNKLRDWKKKYTESCKTITIALVEIERVLGTNGAHGHFLFKITNKETVGKINFLQRSENWDSYVGT